MSQTATNPEGSTQAAKAANTGRAVLLLALFVALGVLLLNAIDEPSAETAVIARPVPETTVPVVIAPTTVPSRLPSDVKVLVANGVGVDGAASRMASRLQPMGYLLVTPGNTTTPSPESAVAYTEGFRPEAEALATSLSLPASAVRPLDPALVPALDGANVVVVVGNDLASVSPSGIAPAGSAPSGNPAAGTPVGDGLISPPPTLGSLTATTAVTN